MEQVLGKEISIFVIVPKEILVYLGCSILIKNLSKSGKMSFMPWFEKGALNSHRIE